MGMRFAIGVEQTEDPKTGCEIYICPSCGLKVDEEDYEYESDEEVEWTEEMLDMEQGEIPPADGQRSEHLAGRHPSL